MSLECESFDWMYLKVYVLPRLQGVGGVVWYMLRWHPGQRFGSTAAVTPNSEGFVQGIEQFAKRQRVDLVSFPKGKRKDDITQQYLRRFRKAEGLLYNGKAQEKERVMRTERRRCERSAWTYPCIVESTAMVKHCYCYWTDEDFEPFFLNFCSYFPYTLTS